MKREATEQAAGSLAKRQATDSTIEKRFSHDLFSKSTVDQYTTDYAGSTPYKHAVVRSFVNDNLLRSVRKEIIDNIHFTPKETDIYKIHQSGDLANLSGLPENALKKLPNLLKLRDALYSPDFREWIATVSGSGPLSGKKTDMAVNVYVPGCHLLCHDDVIGSRRVSYILYLTDPDKPWKPSWGGALRLYPTDVKHDSDGKEYKVPRPEFDKVIPPQWNQLSFFAVQPGESFHDVEEVYHLASGDDKEDGDRVRMAISGWFHIPQEGEDGFEPDLEAKLAEMSSLQQLQGQAEQFDEPQLEWQEAKGPENSATNSDDDGDVELTEDDLHFLLDYITPTYLTPDTVEELNELFEEESTLQLANFLSKRIAPRLKKQIESDAIERDFYTSRPPYKHRYVYLRGSSEQRTPPAASKEDPFGDIFLNFLPSRAFQKWLSLATGLTLKRSALLARRFRKSLDYQLAQGYSGNEPQLEYTLCVTPSSGWSGDDADDAEQDVEYGNENGNCSGGNGKHLSEDEDNVGGYELYMAGDDDDDASDGGSDHGVTIPSGTGAGNRRSSKKADPAVYQAAQEDEDDGILFSNPATWNTLSIALRDKGVLKFVKYVSKKAQGDRWDFTGCVEVVDGQEDDDEADDEEEEEEFNGFED
ncbi:putative component of NuA3 histone acetyltransferase complex [Oleoguttula sp. CCFEE 5521]